jgi:hypothetical protein
MKQVIVGIRGKLEKDGGKTSTSWSTVITSGGLRRAS